MCAGAAEGGKQSRGGVYLRMSLMHQRSRKADKTHRTFSFPLNMEEKIDRKRIFWGFFCLFI